MNIFKNQFSGLVCKDSTTSLQSIVHDRKRCVVLNFSHSRNGQNYPSNCDEIERLEETFSRKLNFKFNVVQVANYSKAKEFLNKELKDVKNKFAVLVLFLLTNGNMMECLYAKLNILCTHETILQLTAFCLNDLLEYFNYNEGRKFKLIFLLGSKIEHVKSKGKSSCIKTKSYADFLLFYGQQVSSTIRFLCSILQENISTEYDLVTMIKMVFNALAAENNQDDTPFIISALTKSILIQSRRIEYGDRICDNNQTVYPDKKYLISNGLCMIFNFKKVHTRNDMDVDSLKVAFSGLHFEISENKNLLILKEDFYFENYDCLVICVLGSGSAGGNLSCGNLQLNIEGIVNMLAGNKSLCEKPKLLFILSQAYPTNEADKYDQPILLKLSPDMFISYGLFQEVLQHDLIKNWSNWFIQLLCNRIQSGDFTDLETMATEAADALETCFDDNESRFSKKFQIPYYYSTLTKPLLFEPDEEKLNRMPDRGRCVILNYSDKNKFDTRALAASFVDLKFYCKTHYELSYDKTKSVLEKESQKTSANCKCLVLCIYSNCYDKGFQCGNKRQMSFKEVLLQFRKIPTDVPTYIFINSTKSVSSNNDFIQDDYYCEQVGNVFFSYNARPVNQLALTILQTSWPKEKSISKMFTEMADSGVASNNDQNDCLWKKLQLLCLTNTNELLPKVSQNPDSLLDIDFNKMTYKQDEDKRNRCLVLCIDGETNCEPTIQKIQKVFQTLPQFNFNVEKIQNIAEISSALERENYSLESYNSLLVFIFADVTDKEINEINIQSIFVQDCAKDADEIPKIFLIQSSKVTNNINLNKWDHCDELLLAIINDDYSFIEAFCDVLSQQNVQYDMINLINLTKLTKIYTKQILFMLRSSLSKVLFFGKSESLRNLDFIKSDALFYKNGKGKYLLIKQISNNSIKYNDDIEELGKTMKKLKFDFTKEVIFKDFESHLYNIKVKSKSFVVVVVAEELKGTEKLYSRR